MKKIDYDTITDTYSIFRNSIFFDFIVKKR